MTESPHHPEKPPAPDVFDRLVVARRRRLRASADELALIAEACVVHRVDEAAAHEAAERLVDGGADGTPRIGEYLALELAGLLKLTPDQAALQIRQVLNLRWRHPHLWAAVQALQIEGWQASRVARACASAGLTATQAAWVDEQLAATAAVVPWPRAVRRLAGLIVAADPGAATERARRLAIEHRVTLSQVEDGQTSLFAILGARDGLFLDGMLDRLADLLRARGEAGTRQNLRARALGILATPAYATHLLASATGQGELALGDPEQTARPAVLDLAGVDPDRLLPKTVLHVHVHDSTVLSGCGVARAERAGPLTVEMLREFVANTRVRVAPVLDHDHLPAVDAYEIPGRLREAIVQRHVVEAFPWSNRRSRGCEQDHTTPYDWNAPPGALQTRAGNLGPLAKRTHRAKHHAWRATQLVDGAFHWRSPRGFHYLVTPSATIPLGRERPRSGRFSAEIRDAQAA